MRRIINDENLKQETVELIIQFCSKINFPCILQLSMLGAVSAIRDRKEEFIDEIGWERMRRINNFPWLSRFPSFKRAVSEEFLQICYETKWHKKQNYFSGQPIIFRYSTQTLTETTSSPSKNNPTSSSPKNGIGQLGGLGGHLSTILGIGGLGKRTATTRKSQMDKEKAKMEECKNRVLKIWPIFNYDLNQVIIDKIKIEDNSIEDAPVVINMVGQNRGTTGTLQGTNRRGNLRPKAENRIFRGNLA